MSYNNADQPNTTKAANKRTHYGNVVCTYPDGSRRKFGAVYIYSGGDKNQRTVLDLQEKLGAEEFAKQVSVSIEIQSAEKSTDVEATDNLGIVMPAVAA